MSAFLSVFSEFLENRLELAVGRNAECAILAAVGVFSDKVIEIEAGKLLVQHCDPLLGRKISSPCGSLGTVLAVPADLLDVDEYVLVQSLTVIYTCSQESAVGAVEGIDKQIWSLTALYAVRISAKILIHVMLAFHLADTSIFSQEPVNIFLKSAGHGIN